MVLGLAVFGSASCGSDPDAATAQDLERLETRVEDLQRRLGPLEALGGDEEARDRPLAEPADDSRAFFTDPGTFVGDRVTVTAVVTELTASTDAGVAFSISGAVGDAVAVVSADPEPALDEDDLLQVTGMVVEMAEPTFQEDVGIAPDDLFDDAEQWFEETGGQPAIVVDVLRIWPPDAED
jgi:hypothetical protein